MIKKLSVILLSVVLVMSVVGCSSEGNKPDDIVSNEAEPVVVDDNDKEEIELEEADDSVGKVDKSEMGTRVTVRSEKGLTLEQQSGPFTIKLTDIQLSHFEPSNSYKDMFDGKDELTVVTIAIEVENESTETNAIYPDQGTITTDTKEQVEADLFLSDNVGGDFMGEIIKTGNVIFLLDSNAKDINNIKYIVGGGRDESFNSVGEDIVFDIDFK